MGRGEGSSSSSTKLSGRRHGADWREHLDLNVEQYTPEMAQKIEQVTRAIISSPPVAPPPPEPPLYEVREDRGPLPDDVPHIYGVRGYPRSGKDVVADYLLANYEGIERFATSDPIRAEVNDYLSHYPDAEGQVHLITPENKSDPNYRLILQDWAVARRAEDPDYWYKKYKQWVEERLEAGTRLVMLTGVRAPNEVELVHELQGDVLWPQRPGNPYRAEHPIEHMLDHLPESDFVIIHNPVEGDLVPYEENIEAAIRSQDQPHLPSL